METIIICIHKNVSNSLVKSKQLNNRVFNEVSDIPELKGLSISLTNPELKVYTEKEFDELQYETRFDIRDSYNIAVVKAIMYSEICLN